MNKKKDLYNLHCRIENITIDKLKSWADDLGYSIGEMIDHVVEGYEDFCKSQDEWLERDDVYNALSKLNEKLDRIEKKIGA